MKVIFYWVLYPLIRPFYLISVILNTLVLGSIIIAISPFDRNGNVVHYIGKFWSLLNIYLSGTRLTIKGTERIKKGHTYIVMSNHQSLVDPWILIGKLPLQLRWTIKSEVKKMPIFGYALERMGHIYVGEKKRKQRDLTLQKALKKLKKGSSVVIFPEGTRSDDGYLQRFHKGGAIIAMRSGVPILPVTINGSRFVLPKGTLALMPGKIEVIVGESIDSGMFGENGKGQLIAGVKSAIQQNLDLKYGAFVKNL
ncbi:MAG TPA: lysophospholipid acyltransferase family protein [Desulfatiglandales bacterium]|nr:lysophospholipid acyltransferase family protein [Desulfatiglandales bacterium]